MTHDAIGQLCSLLAAVTWAFALVWFKQSTERVSPIALNLFKNAVALALFAMTLAVQAAWGDSGFQRVGHVSDGDLILLLFSGVIGIALADTLFFRALNVIGVGLMSVVDCCYSPSVVLFSWLLLSERLAPFQYVGAAMIIVGVFVASRHDPPVGRTRRQIVAGMALAAVAVSLMALGIVLAKPVLDRTPLVWATALRLAAGSALLAVLSLLDGNWRKHWAVFRPSAVWKTAVPASVLGMYICLLLWVAGFKYTGATVAGVLNQTSVVFAIVLATVILKEPFDRRKLAAVALSLSGVAIVTLSSGRSG